MRRRRLVGDAPIGVVAACPEKHQPLRSPAPQRRSRVDECRVRPRFAPQTQFGRRRTLEFRDVAAPLVGARQRNVTARPEPRHDMRRQDVWQRVPRSAKRPREQLRRCGRECGRRAQSARWRRWRRRPEKQPYGRWWRRRRRDREIRCALAPRHWRSGRGHASARLWKMCGAERACAPSVEKFSTPSAHSSTADDCRHRSPRRRPTSPLAAKKFCVHSVTDGDCESDGEQMGAATVCVCACARKKKIVQNLQPPSSEKMTQGLGRLGESLRREARHLDRHRVGFRCRRRRPCCRRRYRLGRHRLRLVGVEVQRRLGTRTRRRF